MEREMLHCCGLVRATWRSVDRLDQGAYTSFAALPSGLDRTRKERSFWTQRKEPNSSFQSAIREGIKLTWNIWQSHETAYMAGVRFACPACLHLILFVSGKGPKHVLFVLILKRKIGDQNFPSTCVSLRRKYSIKISVASWCLPKKVNFGPWGRADIWGREVKVKLKAQLFWNEFIRKRVKGIDLTCQISIIHNICFHNFSYCSLQ